MQSVKTVIKYCVPGISKAEDYRWSSAAAHCGLKEDALLSKKPGWTKVLDSVEDWSDWLSVEEDSKRLDVLRKHVEKGLPCGTDDFVQSLGKKIGRALENRAQGRPKKEIKG